MLRHFYLLMLVVAASAPFTACRPRVLTLDDVIERHVQAMGGRAALEAVHAVEIDLHIKDPGFEVDGLYRAARPGKMRIDVRAGGKHVFTEAFDGKEGWQWKRQGGSEYASPQATAALRRGVELPGKLFGLHELRQRGHKLELAGRDRVDAIDYYVIRLTMTDGYSARLYIDPNSWLITRRRDVRPLHVDVDPTPTTIEQRSTDFRKVGGVMFAFASVEVNLSTGKELEATRINEIKINPLLDDSLFEFQNPG